jgi:hypothetical protein
MRRFALLLGILLALPLAARAQSNKNEIFAGYAVSLQDAGHASASLGGWEAAYTRKFGPYFGLTADFAGHYASLFNSRTNLHTYLFGPEICLPMKFSPFIHILGGWTRLSLQGTIRNAGSMALGGGVDYRLNPSLHIRIIQVDFVTAGYTQISPNGRYSTGLVFRF